MRQDRTVQASIFDLFAKHEIGCELKKASAWLDDHPALIGLVAGDLRRDTVQETGRQGLPAEAVLRCALLVRAGPGKACDEAEADRVRSRGEDDRYRRGRPRTPGLAPARGRSAPQNLCRCSA